jgi:hypothetical protein
MEVDATELRDQHVVDRIRGRQMRDPIQKDHEGVSSKLVLGVIKYFRPQLLQVLQQPTERGPIQVLRKARDEVVCPLKNSGVLLLVVFDEPH